MQKVTGPECPRCGCEQSEILTSKERQIYERRGGHLHLLRIETHHDRVCLHCSRRFRSVAKPANGQLRGAAIVHYERLRCPHCKSPRTLVTSSPAVNERTGVKTRHHRCQSCRQPFTSRETPED